MIIKALLALVTLTGPLMAIAGTYKIDESHTQVSFKIKHLVIATVSGRFNKFSGDFKYDSVAGKVEGLKTLIETSSVDTNEPDRDKHLKSKEFFDVEKFKNIEFKGKEFSIKEKSSGEVKGDLTIHGVTKPVILKVDFKGEATDPWGNNRLVFEAQTNVNRKDFGLTWNKGLDKGGVMIADDVVINIEGEAILQKETEKSK